MNALENHDHFQAAAQRLIGNSESKGERLIRLGEACQFLRATRGEQARPSTLVRWILRGKLGVRLDAVKLNGKGWLTSREALARFAASLSARAAGQAIPPPTLHDREKRDAAAKVRLRAMGVKC